MADQIANLGEKIEQPKIKVVPFFRMAEKNLEVGLRAINVNQEYIDDAEIIYPAIKKILKDGRLDAKDIPVIGAMLYSIFG